MRQECRIIAHSWRRRCLFSPFPNSLYLKNFFDATQNFASPDAMVGGSSYMYLSAQRSTRPPLNFRRQNPPKTGEKRAKTPKNRQKAAESTRQWAYSGKNRYKNALGWAISA